jgi:L,D-peptidoglycan transpeptidase YkuD (ErfK/YbiS/YcfS/YnhG family)
LRPLRPKAGTRHKLRAAALVALMFPVAASAQTCPAPLDGATRLVLVTADTMHTQDARLQTFVRDRPDQTWKTAGPPEAVVIGRAGMAWAPAFRQLARTGEPIKREGDKRAPAGVYAVGRSFGTLASQRPGYLHVRSDTVCVDDSASPAYNTITTRDRIGPKVSVEHMSRMLPMYRRGIVVDYPTDARARAGSCIFIHVWRTPKTGTAGCVALPEARVEALQDFVEPGATIAIMPREGLARLRGCLPGATAQR